MSASVVDRRRLLLGGSAGVGLGALTVLSPATAYAAGIDTRAALSAALDRYAATRVGTIGLAVRDNRDGQNFFWRPRTLQSYSTIKVLILVALLKRAQDRGVRLTSTQKSLASRMIRYSDNVATDTPAGADRGVDLPAGGRPARHDAHRRAGWVQRVVGTLDDDHPRPVAADELAGGRYLPLARAA